MRFGPQMETKCSAAIGEISGRTKRLPLGPVGAIVAEDQVSDSALKGTRFTYYLRRFGPSPLEHREPNWRESQSAIERKAAWRGSRPYLLRGSVPDLLSWHGRSWR